MITKPIYILTKLVFLQLYPAYMCYKAIKVQQQQQFSPLIVYWMVTSLYLVIEYIADIFFFWFPFYYELKLVLVLWLILPQTNGTEWFYTHHVLPFLSSHESLIDQTVIDLQTHVKSTIVFYGQKLIQFLRTFVSESLFKSLSSQEQPPSAQAAAAAAIPPPPPGAQRDWSPYGIFAALMTSSTTTTTPPPPPLPPQLTSQEPSSSSASSSDTSMERVDSFDSLGSIVAGASTNNNNNHEGNGNGSNSRKSVAAAAAASAAATTSSSETWSGYVSSWIWKPRPVDATTKHVMPPKQSSIKTRLTRPPSRRDQDHGGKAQQVEKGLFDKKTIAKKTKKKHSTIDEDKKDTDNMLNDLVAPRPIEIHQEKMSETDKQLRGFDLDYKYGPCVGLTRLERWERAESLGLDPPQHIKTLLLNQKNDQECLFYGNVI